MRAAVVALGLLAAGLVASPPVAGQQKPPEPEEVPPRYGQQFKPKVYPQGTVKEAVASVIAAAEKGDYPYLAAHLLDPAFVDARLDAVCAGPKNPYITTAVAETRRLVDIQLKNPDALPRERKLPLPKLRPLTDVSAAEVAAAAAARIARTRPAAFTGDEDDATNLTVITGVVVDGAKAAAFAQFTRVMRDKFGDDPETLKDLRRFARGGAFPDPGAPGDSAKVELPDVKDRALFLKRAAGRWYVENRQTEEKAATPPAPPVEPKKD